MINTPMIQNDPIYDKLLALGVEGSALNFARQLPNALSGPLSPAILPLIQLAMAPRLMVRSPA
jgi:hypothetical protein